MLRCNGDAKSTECVVSTTIRYTHFHWLIVYLKRSGQEVTRTWLKRGCVRSFHERQKQTMSEMKGLILIRLGYLMFYRFSSFNDEQHPTYVMILCKCWTSMMRANFFRNVCVKKNKKKRIIFFLFKINVHQYLNIQKLLNTILIWHSWIFLWIFLFSEGGGGVDLLLSL